MKKISILLLLCMILTTAVGVTSVSASSLDDIINDDYSNDGTGEDTQTENSNSDDNQSSNNQSNANEGNIAGGSELVEDMKDATNLYGSSSGASKINSGIKKVASFVIQVLSYAVTVCLVVRVLLDLTYIVLPFTRSFLSNGYAGNPQSNGSPMQQPGMGGMGAMGGMGSMGGYGGYGGYGSGRYGMGGMGAMGGMGGMNAMQQGMSQPGATPAMGRIQWVSTAALNAAAVETVPGSNGKATSPLKFYAKDMVIILVLTPIFLVLAITGALTDLGLLLGEGIARLLSNVGNMI